MKQWSAPSSLDVIDSARLEEKKNSNDDDPEENDDEAEKKEREKLREELVKLQTHIVRVLPIDVLRKC